MLDCSLLPGFLIATLLINISPGPEMMFVISTTISSGKRQGVSAALGAATGSTIHVLMVAFGLAVILSTSLLAFTVVKILGAVYLCYLGIRTIVSRTAPVTAENRAPRITGGYRKGFFVGVLNPKSIIFFLAFLPQFVNTELSSYTFQIITLGLCTVAAGILVDSAVVLLVNGLADIVSRKKRITAIIDKLTGMVLICFGVKLALSTQRD
jgi:threonine/homoserine/homoserine lactone efflux protein